MASREDPDGDFGYNPAGRLSALMSNLSSRYADDSAEKARLHRQVGDWKERRRYEQLQDETVQSVLMEILGCSETIDLLRRLSFVLALPGAVRELIRATVDDSTSYTSELESVDVEVKSLAGDLDAKFLQRPQPFLNCKPASIQLRACDQLLRVTGPRIDPKHILQVAEQLREMAAQISKMPLSASSALFWRNTFEDMIDALSLALLVGNGSHLEQELARLIGSLAMHPAEVAEVKADSSLWKKIRSAIVDVSVVLAGVAACVELADLPAHDGSSQVCVVEIVEFVDALPVDLDEIQKPRFDRSEPVVRPDENSRELEPPR